MGRTRKNELAELANTARAHLKRAEALGRSLDQRMKEKRAADDGWIPDEDWRRDFAAVNAVIQHGGNSLVRALEGNKKNLGGMTEAQLEAQLASELVRSAQTMPEAQWQAMLAARAKKEDS